MGRDANLSRGRLESWALAAIGVVALLPALVLLIRCLARPLPDTGVSGDAAVAELYTLQACHGAQLLGPYSRNGFHHPGPAMFYALAPIYALCGHRHAALCLGALLLNIASLAALPLIVARAGRAGAATWTCVAVGLYGVFLQPSLLLSVWNPYLSMVPFAVAVVAGLAAATGRTALLPVALVAASFAVQSHVAYVSPLLAAAGVGLVFALRRRDGRGSGGHLAIHLIVSAALMALLWVPPLLEEVLDKVGNVGRMIAFFRHATPAHTLFDAATEVGWRTSAFLVVGRGGQDQLSGVERLAATALTVLQVVILGWGARRSISRGDRFAAGLCVAGLALIGAAVVAVRAITDPFFDHLVRWTSAIGLVGLIALAAAFSDVLRRRLSMRWASPVWVEGALCVLLLSPVAVVGMRQVLRYPPLSWHVANAFWSGPEETLGRPVLAALARERVLRPHLRIVTHGSWPQAAGLVASLAKAGVAVSVPERWTFMLGHEFAHHGDDGVLLVGSPAELNAFSAAPGVEVVADAGDTRVLLAAIGRQPVQGTVDFGELRSELYLRDGFFYPERDAEGGFRWSDGDASLVSLPLGPGVAYQMTVTAMPISVPGRTQALEVELNGEHLGSAAFAAGGWSKLTFRLPAEKVRAANLLAFRYALTRSPAEMNGSGDMRRLSVAFRSLKLDAVP